MAGWDVLFTREGRQLDGVAEADVKRMLKSGELRPDDCLRRVGETRWRQVAELRGGAKAAAAAAPAAAAAVAAAEAPPAADPPSVAAALKKLEHVDDDELEADFSSHVHQDNLDMTPMVDVVLLLLLFFMVTASYSMQKILDMTKPDPKVTATSTPKPDIAKDNVIIEIDARSNIFVDAEPVRGKTTVRTVVERAAREGNKKKAIVSADGKALHEACVRAIDGCRQAGIADINFSVKTDD